MEPWVGPLQQYLLLDPRNFGGFYQQFLRDIAFAFPFIPQIIMMISIVYME